MSVSEERQFEEAVGLYKFHSEQAIKLINLIYVVTGAILSYYFLYAEKLPPYGFSVLALPVILNIGFCCLVWMTKQRRQNAQEKVKQLCADPNPQSRSFCPSFYPLSALLWVLFFSSLLIVIGVGGLLIYESINFINGL